MARKTLIITMSLLLILVVSFVSAETHIDENFINVNSINTADDPLGEIWINDYLVVNDTLDITGDTYAHDVYGSNIYANGVLRGDLFGPTGATQYALAFFNDSSGKVLRGDHGTRLWDDGLYSYLYTGSVSPITEPAGWFNVFQPAGKYAFYGLSAGEEFYVDSNMNIVTNGTITTSDAFFLEGSDYYQDWTNQGLFLWSEGNDPLIELSSNNSNFQIGIDNSDNEDFEISRSSLSANNDFLIDVDTGVVSIGEGLTIGDTTNYLNINDKGQVSLAGTAQYYEEEVISAYMMTGLSGTINGISCTASSTTLFPGSLWMGKDFGDGTSTNVCDALTYTIHLPGNYVSGTNISLEVSWAVSGTTGNVSFGYGYSHSDSNNLNTATHSFVTQKVSPNPSSYVMSKTILSIDGTGLEAHDQLSIILYRYGDDVADTTTGTAYIISTATQYLVNAFGEYNI